MAVLGLTRGCFSFLKSILQDPLKAGWYSGVHMHGKLIVIDGADGSGKATQTRMLTARLKAEGYAAETLDFPGTQKTFLESLFVNVLMENMGTFSLSVHASHQHSMRQTATNRASVCGHGSRRGVPSFLIGM